MKTGHRENETRTKKPVQPHPFLKSSAITFRGELGVPTPILLSASNASGIVSAGDSGKDERRLVCEKT